MDIRDKILSTSLALFMKFGVKSITMDEIAKEVGVSKKTIYQNFADKSELVLEATKLTFLTDQCFFDTLINESENAIEEVFRIANHIREKVAMMNPSLLFDLKKFHVKAWEFYNQHKNECFEKSVIDNIKRGIHEGYYRKNINVKILSRLRMLQIESIFDQEWFPPEDFNLVETQIAVFEHFIHGLVTEKGLTLYNQYLQNENN